MLSPRWSIIGKAMRKKTFFAVAAPVLICSLFAWTEAVARGGGGGHGAGIRASHAGHDFGLQHHQGHWDGADWHGKNSRDADRSGNAGRDADWHGVHSHVSNGRKSPSHEGHWHELPGFGRHEQAPSGGQGEWHRSSGFGSDGQVSSSHQGEWHRSSSGFQRQWEADGR